MKFFLSAIALATATLTGCAYYPTPPDYNPKHSRAYNIVYAGGMATAIDDTTRPADMTGSMMEDSAFVLGHAISPAFGMSNLQGGLLGLFGALVEPPKHGERNTLMAWLPVEAETQLSPKQAREKLINQIVESLKSTYSELGASFDSESMSIMDYGDYAGVVAFISNNDWGCPEWDENWDKSKGKQYYYMCRINMRLYTPYLSSAPSPAYGLGIQGPAYKFSAGSGYDYSYITFKNGEGKNSLQPQIKLYEKLSQKLPAGIVLYQAPGEVLSDKGEKTKIPYLLDRGKTEFFVYPD